MGACIADGSSEGCGDGSDASGLDCQQGAGAKCAAGTNADAQGCTVGSIANSCLVTGNDATVVCVSTGSGGDAPE